ncbi:sugar transferase [Phenylobacterium montanum]|uniref:Sugar transferase n=1 Tax=Phenylobacterium montanum TaxID=2823693 RepID=A0A975FWA5_9CAUL|nr:sugar transferase [Caulobacter sp. S6]QUD86037.1 sugar transferase [Caulobacter sp. S6]
MSVETNISSGLGRPSGITGGEVQRGESLGRLVDISVSCFALVFLAPMMALVALAIWLQDGGPIIYAQTRIGRGGVAFKCLKFRSMLVDADQRLQLLLTQDPAARAEWDRDHKLRDDPRITGLGTFLRRSSVDEIPQLINVLRGEMSLVGPRPIVAAEAKRYGHYMRHYCSVNPGITGLWQVSGRNDVSYRRRVALDVTYARSKSFLLDLKILLATIPAVLLRRGSY